MKKSNNFTRFYALLKRLPGNPTKEQFVLDYTKNRTSSLREMDVNEYEAMCDSMQRVIDGEQQVAPARDLLRKSRSKVLHWIQRAGVDTTDWNRINAFCMDKRVAGKVFRELTVEELDALVPKLKAISRKATTKVESKMPVPRELLEFHVYQLN